MILGLNNLIDMDKYNALVMKGGGDPIITKKQLISMKAFIGILLKIFRKDYISKYRKGGFNDTSTVSDLGSYNSALKIGNLNYSNSYSHPSFSSYERDFI
jgi:hypothetical protein